MPALTFDASTVQARESSFAPIPPGVYTAEITDTEIRDCSGGKLLRIRWDILGPEHAGRVVWDRVLTEHRSEVALGIAREKLAGIVKACGLTSISSTEELHGKPCQIKVKIRRSEEHGDSNEVVGAGPARAGQPKPPAAPSRDLDDDRIPF